MSEKKKEEDKPYLVKYLPPEDPERMAIFRKRLDDYQEAKAQRACLQKKDLH